MRCGRSFYTSRVAELQSETVRLLYSVHTMNLEGRPRHSPEADQTAMYDERDPIDLDAVPLSGGVLVKALALSIDPYLRGLMREPDVSLYGVRCLDRPPPGAG